MRNLTVMFVTAVLFSLSASYYAYRNSIIKNGGHGALLELYVVETKIKGVFNRLFGRHDSLMVSVLISGLSGPGSSPGRRHCVRFLSKTLYSRSASLHPGI